MSNVFSNQPLQPYVQGTAFAGKYQLKKEVGRGCMSVVFQAVNLNLNKKVAIKFPLLDSLLYPHFISHILQGARLFAPLSHRGIAGIYDVDEYEGLAYVVMEFLQGENLSKRVWEQSSQPLGTTLAIVSSLMETLCFIHHQGVVHLNIKPDNILICEKNSPVLVSFDLSMPLKSHPIPLEFICMKDLEFMAPEVIGEQPLDQRADIWSLGATLYHMLTGASPFCRKNTEETMEAIANFDPPKPSLITLDSPEELDELILKMLAKDPKDRFQTMEKAQKEFLKIQSRYKRELENPTRPSRIFVQNQEEITNQTGEAFQLIKLKGQGNFGLVYKAMDLRLQRTVAIKQLKKEYINNQEILERFYREAQSVSTIQHPNVMQIYSLGELEGLPFFVMPYFEGKDLSWFIQNEISLALPQILELSVGIASGLGALHQKGVIHRDLKPNNILLDQDMRPVITDFGIVRLQLKTRLTPVGITLGTFVYMSPEQTQNEELTPSSDLYSLGVMMYEMITNSLPFDTPSTASIQALITPQTPFQLISRGSSFPQMLAKIIEKLLRIDQKKRYQSARELIIALEEAQKELETAWG